MRKSQYFPFQCWVLNKATTGTNFITSLVWRVPWLGINPGPPAHDASTLPLGYRGGGIANMNVKNNWLKYLHLPETVYCMLYRKTAHCVPQSPLHHTRYSRAFLFRLVIWKLYQKQVIRSLSVKWKIKNWVIYTNIYISNFRFLHKVS